jgi:hypothetical protein
VLAKEVGMTFVTGADVVMIVTTGEFTRDAFQYAYRMMEVSRYYMVLIQKEDIEAIKEDRTNIIKILDRRARRVFAKNDWTFLYSKITKYISYPKTYCRNDFYLLTNTLSLNILAHFRCL